ncbi:hypothetical protein ACLESD_09020, partial [Pyxidicoccus sp. 3LFB2]
MGPPGGIGAPGIIPGGIGRPCAGMPGGIGGRMAPGRHRCTRHRREDERPAASPPAEAACSRE